MLAEAQAEKKALIDALSKPSGISEEEAIGAPWPSSNAG